MKKLVLSAVLGVFCYCTNNAAKNPIDINKVLTIMLKGQLSILIAKDEMKKYEAKIYSKIKEENGKVTKYKLYSFIETQFPEDAKLEHFPVRFLQRMQRQMDPKGGIPVGSGLFRAFAVKGQLLRNRLMSALPALLIRKQVPCNGAQPCHLV